MTRPNAKQLDALCTRCRAGLRGRNRELFDAWAQAAHQRVPNGWLLQEGRSFARALARCPSPSPRSWLEASEIRTRLFTATRPPERRYVAAAVAMANDVLCKNGVLPARLCRYARTMCSACGNRRRIVQVRQVLCAQCYAQERLRQRIVGDDLLRRVSSSAKRALLQHLLEYERAHPITVNSVNRVHALRAFLSRVRRVPCINSWHDVYALRDLIDQHSTPTLRAVTRWALHKIGEALVQQGKLEPLRRKRSGSPQEQIRTICDQVRTDDPDRRDLLNCLAGFFLRTRATASSITTTAAFARYLERHPVLTIVSWADYDRELNLAMRERAEGTLVRRGFERLADALVMVGRLHSRSEPDRRIAGRLRPVSRDLDYLHGQFLDALRERRYRPVTLAGYTRMLNHFWTWAGRHNVAHPSQISSILVRQYIQSLRERRCRSDQIISVTAQLRTYFRWLRRARRILACPAVPKIRRYQPVRVYDQRLVQNVVRALMSGTLPPRDALITYLMMFHGLRNDEIQRVVGYSIAEREGLPSFQIEPPARRLSAKGFHPASRQQRILLRTDLYPWIGVYLDRYLCERARMIKRPESRYLFVTDRWRPQDGAITETTVRKAVHNVTRAACRMPLKPSLLRLSAAAYFTSLSDHTIAEALGWSRERAVRLAYAPREILLR